MLHSNSNTHAHQQLNKGSDRHGENAIRAQGVSYNPAGSNENATNIDSTFNTTGNPASNYDSLNNHSSTLNTNTVNPGTQANAEIIGREELGLETHNNLNTSSKLDSHNSSNLDMGNVQLPSINDLPGAYPTNSSDYPLDSKLSTQTGHESTLNKKPITTTTNKSNPQTGIHLNQHENTTHDKLSNNTTGLHSTTTDKSSKLSSGVDQPHFDNDHSTSSHSRLSRIPHETTAAALASHGIALPDQKLHNNTYDHTNPTASTGHNISSVNNEIDGAKLGKVPVNEQNIERDRKHKGVHPHKTNNPERAGETHLDNKEISRDIKNASPNSGTHSQSLSANNSEKLGENRQDEKEVAEGLISEKTHAHLEHKPETVKENHKLDLGEPLDDKKIYADPNSTSLYNEYTPAAPGEGVKPTNPDVTTLESDNHHKHIGNTNLAFSENSGHGSATTHNTGSNIATGTALGAAGLAGSHHDKLSSSHHSNLNNNTPTVASEGLRSSTHNPSSSIATGAALEPAGLANTHHDKNLFSTHNSSLNKNTSSVASGDVGAANLYESQHEPSTHSTGSNIATGAALGATGLDNSLHKKHMSSQNSDYNNKAPIATSGDVGAANLYQSQHEPSIHGTGSNITTGTTLGATSLDNSYHNKHIPSTHSPSLNNTSTATSGDVGTANIYQSHHEPSAHTTGSNTVNDSALESSSLTGTNNRHSHSAHNSGLNNNSSSLGSTNLYEGLHEPSTHSTGPAGLSNVFDEKNSGVVPENTNVQQPTLTDSTLNNSKVPGATEVPTATLKSNF